MKPLEYANYDITKLKVADLPQRSALLKRLMDLIIVFFASFISIPIIAVAAILIKLKSPGPAFFSHERIGYQGKKIQVWKLRTMYVDAQQLLDTHLDSTPEAQAEWDTYFKLKNDPRIISGIGNFLRKSSMDELPQLWNVLKGDMSVVGPRPFPAYHLKEFPIEFQNLRQQVTPGLTGLWQVSARSDGNLQVQENLDKQYIYNNSLMLDIQIILKTFYVVAAQKGAC